MPRAMNHPPEQISMADLFADGWSTPQLPPEEQKEGAKAWILECRGITNSTRWDAPVLYWQVRARQVKFTEDAIFSQRYQRWEVAADSCDGLPHMGWAGFVYNPTFARKPNFSDMIKYVEKKNSYQPGTQIVFWERERRVEP